LLSGFLPYDIITPVGNILLRLPKDVMKLSTPVCFRRTEVWHHCVSKELHGAHHFVVRHAPKGKVAPKVGDPFLL
jgi:hypothetical protein